jgi:hypothetical protein
VLNVNRWPSSFRSPRTTEEAQGEIAIFGLEALSSAVKGAVRDGFSQRRAVELLETISETSRRRAHGVLLHRSAAGSDRKARARALRKSRGGDGGWASGKSK